ncbi:MAG: hypothetical protein V2I33_22105 [Kangiellaceae bacterium]|jgi:hypothetical protein|nr:hypothetical protein [Kangiellaceae bacterium]
MLDLTDAGRHAYCRFVEVFRLGDKCFDEASQALAKLKLIIA